jgi:hypothetical protein
MLKTVGEVLNTKKAPVNVRNAGKGLAAFLSFYTDKFEIEREGFWDDRPPNFTGATYLGQQLGIPARLLEGVIASYTGNTDEVKRALIDICQFSIGRFIMDEGYCQGFISMALGDIYGIEDLCSAIRYDADIAEVLAILAGSTNISYSYLKQSTPF